MVDLHFRTSRMLASTIDPDRLLDNARLSILYLATELLIATAFIGSISGDSTSERTTSVTGDTASRHGDLAGNEGALHLPFVYCLSK